MELPDTESFIKANNESSNKLLDVMMLSGDNEEVDDNLTSWDITSVTST